MVFDMCALKLCFISPYPPTVCGIADYTNCLVKGILENKPDLRIHVVAEKSARSDDPRVIVHSVFDRRDFRPSDIINVVRDLDINVVHIQHEFGIFGADERFIELLRFLKGRGLKVVVTFHTVHSNETARFRVKGFRDVEEYNRVICSLCDHVIVHTNSMRNVLARQGVPEDKISMFRIGLFDFGIIGTEKARRGLKLPLDRKLLVFTGFFHRGKGMHILLGLVRELSKYCRDFKLIMAGAVHPLQASRENVDYVEELKSEIKRLGIEDFVEIRHCLSRVLVTKYICAADVVLFPYLSINWSASGAIKIAIAASKPFIVTRIPKFEEVSEEISDEIVVLPDEVERMAKIVYRLLYDDDFRSSIVERIKRYAKRITWKNIAGEHLKVYYGLIGG